MPSSETSRPASLPNDLELQELDQLIQSAGLVRSRRGSSIFRPVAEPAALKSATDLRYPAAITRTAANKVVWVPVPAWEELPWLWHGFSTRRGGVSNVYSADEANGELNLSFTAEDERTKVEQNRRLLAEAITGDASTQLASMRQIHSNVTVTAGAGQASRKGDGLMTAEAGILLGIQTADCIPVLVADRRLRAVAAFHAGWRGTAKQIVEKGIGRMRMEFGSRPEDLTAAIGPGIGPCCYAVGEEVHSEFESQFAYAPNLFHRVQDPETLQPGYSTLFLNQRAPGHGPQSPALHVDLFEANRRQLLDAGVNSGAISVVGGCTNCQQELFFSYRGAQGRTGRMMSVIGVAKA